MRARRKEAWERMRRESSAARERERNNAEVITARQFMRQGLSRDDAYRAAARAVRRDGMPRL